LKIHEYQAKEIFREGGIPTPQSIMVKTPEEAQSAAETINKSVAIKSQVLVGGRGKAGGIKFADNPTWPINALKSF
jgi:Succinyl-CoA synthetase, beta subunit